MNDKINRAAVYSIPLVLLNSSLNFGQQESLNVNGKKVEIFTAGLENNLKDKPVIVFENGTAIKYIWLKTLNR